MTVVNSNMTIGNAGLINADLIINQGCSRSFTVIHEDDEGNIIDHTGSIGTIAIEKGNFIKKFNGAVSCGASAIAVTIDANDTKNLSLGEYDWDLIVRMTSGEVIRLIYGIATVTDTYALD